MKIFKIALFFLFALFLFACKSSKTKQKTDSVYSRHLQRHVPLNIISSAMPDNKEDMNLLLFINTSLLEQVRAQKVMDSLYKAKLIQPMMLVAFDGKESDFGFEETEGTAAKEFKQFNTFIDDELYPFIKKRATIRKFNTVAICGFMNASKTAYDVAYNNDNKFQMVGMFSPQFSTAKTAKSKNEYEIIQGMKKRPTIKIFLEDSGIDSSAIEFASMIANKPSVSECKIIPQETGDAALKKMPTIRNFAAFLMWAFPK
jgi:enterochelin esterase-like enzyme